MQSQLSENKLVSEEFDNLEDDAVVFKVRHRQTARPFAIHM
jgi:hypothetical protein